MDEDLNHMGTIIIQQGTLPFKIERAEELITPRRGLAPLKEVIGMPIDNFMQSWFSGFTKKICFWLLKLIKYLKTWSVILLSKIS
jgi:hypothetical protein